MRWWTIERLENDGKETGEKLVKHCWGSISVFEGKWLKIVRKWLKKFATKRRVYGRDVARSCKRTRNCISKVVMDLIRKLTRINVRRPWKRNKEHWRWFDGTCYEMKGRRTRCGKLTRSCICEVVMNSCGCLYVLFPEMVDGHRKNLTGRFWSRVPYYYHTVTLLWKARDGWSAGLSSDDTHAQVSAIEMCNLNGDERKGAPRREAKDRCLRRITQR